VNNKGLFHVANKSAVMVGHDIINKFSCTAIVIFLRSSQVKQSILY